MANNLAAVPTTSPPALLEPAFTALPDIPQSENLPYLWFAHPMSSTTWTKAIAAGVTPQRGQAYYVHGNEVVHLPIIEYSCLFATHGYVQFDPDGSVVRYDKEEFLGSAEVVDAVIVIYKDGKALPAKATFKRALVGCIRPLLQEAKYVESEDWANRSPAHRAASKLPTCWRLYAQAQTKNVQGRKNEYTSGTAVVYPTGPNQWSAIVELSKDETAMQLLNRLKEAVDARYQQ